MKHRFCPHPQPLSQAWERGARAEGSGGVRARQYRTPTEFPNLELLFNLSAQSPQEST